MLVEAQVPIKGSRAAIWSVITDIENAAETIGGIEEIEMLEKPENGFVGLKWRERRILFGKPATVDLRIADASENEFYETRAESDGFEFVTTMRLSESNGGVTLTSTHESRPQTIVARLMVIPMALLFRGSMRKVILQDLNDIKSAVERVQRP